VLLRPDHTDLRIIGLNTGRVLLGVGLTMLVPAALGFAWGEHDEALGFVVGACLAILPGCVAEWRLQTRRPATWQHGMVVAALSWLFAALAGAVPLHLSGHYGSFLDAYFDAMSGFATAGLAVINDLDHLADSVNLWRHLTHFLGGQGLVLLALSLFATGGGAVGMYVGEAREDKILPNVARTARFIWRVSLVYFLAGTASLWVALVAAGLTWSRALFHATTLFMAAFDTGGFAPNTAGIGLYHSATLEVVLSVLMVAGALSFALHYQLWLGRHRELVRNVEVRSLTLTLLGLFAVAAVGLARSETYLSLDGLWRRGFFHLLSAHTGTGFASIPGRLFLTDWGTLAPAAIVFAMGLGAMAGSTAGGIKAIRLSLVTKAVEQEIRGVLLPPDAATAVTYHSGRRQLLRPEVVRSAFMILLLYLALYLLGALVGLFYGFPFDEAMFESTSAAAAVGLSIGITGPTMPTGLEVVYILQMWIGRLEFVAVLALLGFAWSALRGRT
jgi:trk system potassium uptake protein TrkH